MQKWLRLLLLFPDFIGQRYAFRPVDCASFRIFASDWHALSPEWQLNAEGFVLATLIDRPFVAPTMAAPWYFEALPGPLALLFAIEDSASWLWTLLTWRAERRRG